MTRRHQLPHLAVAETFRSRFLGLMGKANLEGTFLWIPRCRSIHTWFMMGSIDVAFLSEDGRILALRETVQPWRFLFGPKAAVSVLELPAGYTRSQKIEVGDLIVCQ